VALSADGNTLAWVSRPEAIKGRERDDRGLEITVYDLVRGSVRARLAGHRRPILALAVSPDGNTVASAAGGAEDAVELKLHDVAHGRELRSLPGHTAPVQALAFSPDCRTLASGGWDRTLRLWDVASGTLRKVPGLEQPLRSRITVLAFSPDGCLLASGGGQAGEPGEVWLLDPATGTRRQPLVVPAPVTCVGFDPAGQLLGVGAQDGTVQLHEIGSDKESQRIVTGVQPVHCLALHPDGRTLALGGPGPLVRLRDLPLEQERATLPGHVGGVCFLGFCRQGRLLIAADNRQRAWLWHAVGW
jgi:WD40 repeat protein